MSDTFEEVCKCMEAEHSVFSYVSREELEGLCGYFECRSVSAGETLWQEGESCDYAAFIASGRVETKKQTEFKGRHVVVGVFSRGALIGALCILDDSPRAVTAVALEDVSLLTITRQNFEKLTRNNPEVAAHLMKGMLLSVSIRLRKSFERLATFF